MNVYTTLWRLQQVVVLLPARAHIFRFLSMKIMNEIFISFSLFMQLAAVISFWFSLDAVRSRGAERQQQQQQQSNSSDGDIVSECSRAPLQGRRWSGEYHICVEQKYVHIFCHFPPAEIPLLIPIFVWHHNITQKKPHTHNVIKCMCDVHVRLHIVKWCRYDFSVNSSRKSQSEFIAHSVNPICCNKR